MISGAIGIAPEIHEERHISDMRLKLILPGSPPDELAGPAC